ncbi:hypothetical protein BJF78_28920 [Pseudonocardia sp. CNS-139]|nr:hypothetical protein BJF78_28920 [Pseudonocardia sp. CNS-139]
MYGNINPNTQGYSVDGLPKYTYDPAKARQLLAEAGHPDGIAFELAVSNAVPDLLDTAVLMKSYAADAGIDITISQQPVAAFSQGRQEASFQALMYRNRSQTQSPTYALTIFWRPNNHNANPSRWENQSFYDAVNRGIEVRDPLSPEAGKFWEEAMAINVASRPRSTSRRSSPRRCSAAPWAGSPTVPRTRSTTPTWRWPPADPRPPARLPAGAGPVAPASRSSTTRRKQVSTVPAPPTPAAADDEAAVRRHGRRVLGVTTLGLMLVIVNATALNVALPAMSAAFGVPAATADWFLVAFMLSSTACILVFGRASDILGRRGLYLGGLVVFTVASAGCALAPDAGTLIALRVVQGVAAATTVANTTTLIADAFPPHRLAHGLGLNITAAGVANTVGPGVGGVMVTTFGWESLFWMTIPFGVAALVLGHRVLPRSPRPDGPRERFDVAGALLSTAGLALLLFGFNRVGAWGADDPRVWGTVAAAVLLLGAFVQVERRSAAPLVDLTLVRDPQRAYAYAAAFFNSFTRAGLVVLVVLHQQMVAHRSAAEAGLVAVPLALLMILSAPAAGRLSDRFPVRTLSTVGGALILLATAGLAVTMADPGVPTAVPALLLALAGAGTGLFTPPNSAAIMTGVVPGRRAVANSVRSVLYNSAQAIGTVATLLVVTTWLASAGVASYAERVDDPAVVVGFVVAAAALTVTGLVACLLSALRGGPWTVRPAR